MPAEQEIVKPIEDFSIVGYYDQQRYKQFNPSDCANWYLVESPLGKKQIAMYPTMGRRHINYLGVNRLVFSDEPRGIFKSINYSYIVVANSIFRIDKFWNQIEITSGKVTTLSSDVFFDYLVTPDVTFAVFVDGQNIYVYREDTGGFYVVTDPNAPKNPSFVAAFGNRIVVSQGNSSQFSLSEINLEDTAFNPATCFTISSAAIFAQEYSIIRQMCVLHNTLYIFMDFNVGVWSNSPSFLTSIGGVQSVFPWTKNKTYDWDFGIQNAKTLSVGFGMICFLAKNSDGLIQAMVSIGDKPKEISTRAIDILFSNNFRQGIIGAQSSFLGIDVNGFLYQWEDTIFYRLSAGEFQNYGTLDNVQMGNSIEYNFKTDTWHRGIEKNGERNRINKHVFFNNTHLVTVDSDSTVYQMSGQIYTNDITNPDAVDPQAADAYITEPFRYERVTPIIAQDDYSEFITDWVQIDFVWGENYNIFSEAPFQNAQFIIDEALGSDGNPVYVVDEATIGGSPIFMITEEGNTPQINELTYNAIYKPHVELYYSDDGGISFYPADVREFSQLGYYQWRMRWYQLGPSRCRCYKLICVSPSPMVVLGGIMMTRRASGGAA